MVLLLKIHSIREDNISKKSRGTNQLLGKFKRECNFFFFFPDGRNSKTSQGSYHLIGILKVGSCNF